MSGGGKGGQTIGFHYLFSILYGIGRGPIDEIRQIKIGDKVAWDGHVCDDSIQAIEKPELFGGEKKEGGVQGGFRLQQGGATQVLPGAESVTAGSTGPYQGATLPDVKALITSETGGLMGELRGRVTLWFDGLVSSMNPYIKTWKFRVRRARKGWHNDVCWYPEKAIIFLADGTIFAMNPAHIIYECLTNPEWGRGLPTSLIDDNSFTYSANTFCDENFGLCLIWFRKEEIGQFIQSVLDHVGAVLYTDRETGRATLKPVRSDYLAANLPVFTPSSGLLDIQEDDTASTDTGVNEVVVTGHDPIRDEDIQMRAHNLGAFRAQGAPALLDQQYKGLPTTDLCARVAQRDLAASAAGLRKFTVVLDRRGFRIHPGAVFRIQFTERGIGDIILRAGEIDDGNLKDGKISIRAVQDVFGLPTSSFVTPSDNIWTAPPDEAVAATAQSLTEATYRQFYLTQGAAEAEAVAVGDSYVVALAGKPSTKTLSYNLLSRLNGGTTWQETGEFFFTGTATLVADLQPTDTSFVVENVNDFPVSSLVDQAIMIGEENMRIDAYDPGTKTFTVARGTGDTWPQKHTLGDRVWLMDDDGGSDGRLYADGEQIEAKIITRTWSDALAQSAASLLQLTADGRIARPYPPAGVTVDADSIYALVGEYPQPTFVWLERNRITQADVLVAFSEATVAAEAGTTYRLHIYSDDSATVPTATHDAITSPWQYTTILQTADGTDTWTSIYCEIVSVRDGLESWNPYRFRVDLKGGYGYNYGRNYGGAG